MADNAPATTGEDAEAAVASAGAELKRGREARSLSIEEVSTDLRIEPHLLHALEGDDYAVIGAPVFVKGYIRQYASRLGLDPVPLVDRYLDTIGHEEIRVEPSRTIKLRDSHQSTVLVLALLGLALIAVFLLIWWYREPATDPAGGTASVPVEEPAAVPFPDTDVALNGGEARRTAPAVRSAVDSSAAAADSIAGPPASTDPAPRSGRLEATQTSGDPPAAGSSADADPAPAAVADTAPAETATEPGGADAAVPVAATNPSPDAAGDAAPAGPEVELVFAEDCWVEITDADDERVLFGLMTSGSRRVVSGNPPLDVFLGNADAAAIRVDGRDFTVPRAARRGNLARFAIPAPTD